MKVYTIILLTIFIVIVNFSQLTNCFALSTINARYVKVLIDKGSGGSYSGAISISELEVFDLAGVNLATSSLASSSSYYGTRFPAKAVDANSSTLFATSGTSGLNPAGSEWLLLDLGAVKQIATIRLSTSLLYSSAVLTDYRILASTDNLVYESVVTVAGASPVARMDNHSMSSGSSGSASSSGFYYELKLSSASGQDLAITFAIFFGIIISTGLISHFGGVVVRMIYPTYHYRRGWY